MAVELEYAVWRVDCPRCGVKVEMVPWADGDSGFTRPFEDTVAHLAQCTDKTTVTRLMRVAWETVGRIIERVVARLGPADRLDGLRSIGIDELSYRRHHEYLTIVSNQDTGEVVWAAPGKDAATVRRFFEELGPERTALIESVTMDMSGVIKTVVAEQALSNGRAEGLNGKVRTITRRSFGFHGAYSLIALIFLCCSSIVITLPHHAPDPSIRAPTKA